MAQRRRTSADRREYTVDDDTLRARWAGSFVTSGPRGPLSLSLSCALAQRHARSPSVPHDLSMRWSRSDRWPAGHEAQRPLSTWPQINVEVERLCSAEWRLASHRLPAPSLTHLARPSLQWTRAWGTCGRHNRVVPRRCWREARASTSCARQSTNPAVRQLRGR